MSPLERRCRRLLRAYPRWYRRQRGDEMLATLLESSRPGQRWPSARDARALIIGGLRVRATQDQRLTTAANLRLAAQLGVALTLLLLIVGNLTSAILIWAHIYAQNIGNGIWSVYGLLELATVVAAWFAPATCRRRACRSNCRGLCLGLLGQRPDPRRPACGLAGHARRAGVFR